MKRLPRIEPVQWATLAGITWTLMIGSGVQSVWIHGAMGLITLALLYVVLTTPDEDT